MKDEFAPVTPGEMLKEEFLAEYGLYSKPACQGDRDFAQPDRGDCKQPPQDHGRYRSSPGSILRQQPGVLAQPPNPL